MGRTLPTITQVFMQEEQAIERFKHALRRSDQRALEDLLAAARQHLSAAAYASYVLPVFLFLLSMLLEEHKHLLQLENELKSHEAQHERLDS
jgi:hypothetical protein